MNRKDNLVYDVRDVFTVREIVLSGAELFHDECAFIYREGKGVREVTYAELCENVKAFSTYLNSRSLEGKKIGVLGKNSYEWALTYLSVCAGTGIIVPLDKELKPEELQYVIDDSELSAIVYMGGMEDKINALSGDWLRLPAENMADMLRTGENLLATGDTSFADHKIDPKALGILLYTSGTTGLAKGVMLSQYNVCSDIVRVVRKVSVGTNDRVLSVLPLHHTYECTAGLLAILYAGGSIAYNDSLRRLTEDFKLFSPTIFIAVPLILETLRNSILKKYKNIKGGTAVLALQRRASDAVGRANSALSRKIFSTVRDAFGGRLTRILSGAAPLSPEVYKDLERFGFQVLIGYGLTETAPVCIMHSDFYRCADDIGYPVCGVDVKLLDPDENGVGEIAVRGPNVMLGYYKNPEETARVLTDGWFRTGDLARRKENGAYQITGRRKSMIVTQNGKKIFPEELEYYLDKHSLIKESMVFGEEGERDVVVTAAVFPDYEAVDARLSKDGITPDSPEYREKVREIMLAIVREVNEKLPSFRRIMKVNVRKTEFVKTTTRKIKRAAEENKSEGDDGNATAE